MPDMHNHHIPQFHIRLPHGYLNDPNGPIELDGVTHVYFQSRSLADLEVPVEWGHATSTDLVHWTLHRPAMSPTPGGLDSGGCWSGNTVLDGDRVRAYYSGKVNGKRYESVLTALSDEQGGNFDAPAQVVDDPEPDEGITMFRDPFVWKDDNGWEMAVGAAGPDETASIRHYRSEDGARWRRTGNLASLKRTVFDGNDTGAGWECPQILRVDGRMIAVVSSWSHGDGPADVLAFPLDAVPRPRRVDHGTSFYAASVMQHGAHGALLFGWIREGRSQEWWRTAGVAGAISLPRTAWLDADGALGTAPHPALARLRAGDGRSTSGATIGAQAELFIPSASGVTRIRFGDDEWCDVILDVTAGTVTVDYTHASRDERAHADTTVATNAFDDSASSGVRVFLDGSILEVFTPSGRSLTSRVYPLAAPPWHVDAPESAMLWDLMPSVTSATGRAPQGLERRALDTTVV